MEDHLGGRGGQAPLPSTERDGSTRALKAGLLRGGEKQKRDGRLCHSVSLAEATCQEHRAGPGRAAQSLGDREKAGEQRMKKRRSVGWGLALLRKQV